MTRIRTGRRLFALVAALLSLGLATFALAAPAQAWPYKAPAVKWTGHVRFTHDHAFVSAIYRCYGGNEKTHIWVSVKQGPKMTAMSLKQLKKAEGTSLPVGSMLKIRGSELIQKLGALQVEALGPYGALVYPHDAGGNAMPPGPAIGHGVLADFMYRRATTIYGGANEVQRTIIARSFLEL